MSYYGNLINESFKDVLDGAPYSRGEWKRLFKNLINRKASNQIKKAADKKENKKSEDRYSIATYKTINDIDSIFASISNNSKWNTMIKNALSKIEDYDYNENALPSFLDKPDYIVKDDKFIEFICFSGSQDEAMYCDTIIEKFASELSINLKKNNKFIKSVEALTGEDHDDVIHIDIDPMTPNDVADYIYDKIKIIIKKLINSAYKKTMVEKLNKYGVTDVTENGNKIVYNINNIPSINPSIFDVYNGGGIIEIIPDASQDERIALCYVLHDIIDELGKIPELKYTYFWTGDGDEGCIYF